ncbi:MAG: L-fucose/L-arabinose isomerase family protein [Alphaproteobacteria bacterium]
METKKPKIGLLGIMQELYDKMYPDITQRQEAYAKDVVARFKDDIEFSFPKAARNRADIEEIVQGFNQDNEIEAIMVVMLTYGPGLRIVNAFKNNKLPVLLANIQPLSVIDKNWDMSHLTFNQGIHGAQDTANALVHLETPFSVVTDDWQSDSFKQTVLDFAHGARASQNLHSTRIAAFGQMPGMGDILFDPHHFMRHIGPQVEHSNIGVIYRLLEEVSHKEVAAVIAENEANFDIDPKITQDAHEWAAKLQIAIQKFLDYNGYKAWNMYFDQIGLDGRFRQIHMMAASNLMAKGYGYGAEGDALSTSLMCAGYDIAPNPNFTEMYAMDFKEDSILQSHMGEGNWKVARKDKKPKLIDRPLGIGGLDNPPTVLFQIQAGAATIASLVSTGSSYRLVVSFGEILDTEELPKLEMPYGHYHPHNGVKECMNGWLKNGGTHHQVMHLGDVRNRWKIFCELSKIEYIEV